MWVIVAYDVRTEEKEGQRRLRRVCQVCKNFGQRVQKSVFECQVNEIQYEQLKRGLLTTIKKEEDNLRIYRLTEPRERHVEEFGVSRTLFFEEPLVI